MAAPTVAQFEMNPGVHVQMQPHEAAERFWDLFPMTLHIHFSCAHSSVEEPWELPVLF